MKWIIKYLIIGLQFMGIPLLGQNHIGNGGFEERIITNTSYAIASSFSLSYWKNYCNFANAYYLNDSLYGTPLRHWDFANYSKPYSGKGFVLGENLYGQSYIDTLNGRQIVKPSQHRNINEDTTVYRQTALYQKLKISLKKDSWYFISYRIRQGLDRDTQTTYVVSQNNVRDSFKIVFRNVRSHFNVGFSVDTSHCTSKSGNEHCKNLFSYSDAQPFYMTDTTLDTSYNWRLVEYRFKADSNYAYFIIGRLLPYWKSKYYISKDVPKYSKGVWNSQGKYIGQELDLYTSLDDVRLLPIRQYLNVSKDTTLCKAGDSVVLRVLSGEGPYQWRNSIQPSLVLSSSDSIKIAVTDSATKYDIMSPYDTTSVMVYLSKPSYDSISVLHCGSLYWRGKWRTTDGIYRDTGFTKFGCKAYYTLNFKRVLTDKVSMTDSTELRADQDGVSYQWYSCSPWTKLEGETKRSLKGTKGKSYAVILNNGKGCIDTGDCVALGTSSIVAEEKLDWRVYPNPVVDELTIELDRIYSHISVKIFDVLGKLWLDRSLKNNTRFSISEISIPHGSYYLILEADGKSQFYNLRK